MDNQSDVSQSSVKVVATSPTPEAVMPVNAATPAPIPMEVSTDNTPIRSYASFGRRLVALILDQIILSSILVILLIPLGIILGVAMPTASVSTSSEANPAMLLISLVGQLISFVIVLAYMIILTGKKGQTLGKMIMKIKVIRDDNGEVPGIGGAILREVIGKLISGLVLDLGYLWVIWDPKKEAWHDKIARTVVIKL